MREESIESIARMWREHAGHLQAYLNHEREENSRLRSELDAVGNELAAARAQVERLSRQVGELTSALEARPPSTVPSVPDFVKADVPARTPKKPGRKQGHPAALRPSPVKIDRVVEVPLARDDRGRELCPKCRCVLTALRGHTRVVEDLTPANVEAVEYKTRSGMCINCDCRRESRAREQPPPPAGDVPHGQLGLSALAIGVMLRVRHRLPVRQICRVLADMAGLKVSPGALVKQVLRVSRHLGREYEQLLLKMRASGVIHVDETGWRIAGNNAWAWVFTQPLLTLFVPDASRGGKVAQEILGEAFGGTVVSDFYSAYNALAPAGGKQRCLTHLLRELRDETAKDASFADDPWTGKLKRWCKDAIALKKLWEELPAEKYEPRASRIEDRLDELIGAEAEHAEARRLRERLRRHRRELTTFLWKKDVEPTNNPAERALRPLVIARKITGGHRSPEHAEAWMKLASLLKTQEQNGRNVLEATKELLADYWAKG